MYVIGATLSVRIQESIYWRSYENHQAW